LEIVLPFVQKVLDIRRVFCPQGVDRMVEGCILRVRWGWEERVEMSLLGRRKKRPSLFM